MEAQGATRRTHLECQHCHKQFSLESLGIDSKHPIDEDITFYCQQCESTLNIRSIVDVTHLQFLKEGQSSLPGSETFLQDVNQRSSQEPDFVKVLQGNVLSKNYVEVHGFSGPIVVELTEDLGLEVPPSDYNHFLEILGPLREVEVIDVAEQSSHKVYLREFVDHINDADTNKKVLSMQSLEFSATKMRQEMIPPKFIRSIDLIEQAWSLSDEPEVSHDGPEVSRFLQINMAGSFVEFHLDAGGSSIWHHVMQGTEVFYLAKGPMNELLDKYEEWTIAESRIFFHQYYPELEFHKVEVTEGQTIFLPGGFIRAMSYPEQTVVVGGSYLHIFNTATQMRIYELEKYIHIKPDHLFPNFEEVFWRFAFKVCKDFIGGGGVLYFKRYWREHLKTIYKNLLDWKQYNTMKFSDLKIVGLKKILKDLAFIVDEAKDDPDNEGQLILNCTYYEPQSF